jgi:hypothetical protein
MKRGRRRKGTGIEQELLSKTVLTSFRGMVPVGVLFSCITCKISD